MGQATAIELEVRFADGTVQLRVQDNGCGFEPDAATTPGGHFGLQGMRERLEAVHGNLEIRSHAGQGTDLLVTIRLEPRPHEIRTP